MKDNEAIYSIQFIDNYFPVIDGVVETVHNYALNMNATVVCPKMTRDFKKQDLPYEVLTCPTFRVPFSQLAVALPFANPGFIRKLSRKKPDILHAHSPALLGEYALAMGHMLGIPVVATFHSKIYDAVLEYTKSKEIAKAITHDTVRFYERCDAVWSCSEGTADTLRSYGYKGDITIMTNGTGLSFPGDPDRLRSHAAEVLKLPHDKHILLFVGQMVWYKNQRLILDTFRLLCNERPDYCLVMAGTGKDVNAVREYAHEIGLTDEQVILTGKIEDRQLLTGLYLNADLFFFPSVFDNTPLVMREAAALGIPTLATEGSNAAEPIQKDVNGFTAAENASAMCSEINKIFASPDLRKSAGEMAKKTIPIGWQDLIPQVEDGYREIIDIYQAGKTNRH